MSGKCPTIVIEIYVTCRHLRHIPSLQRFMYDVLLFTAKHLKCIYNSSIKHACMQSLSDLSKNQVTMFYI